MLGRSMPRDGVGGSLLGNGRLGAGCAVRWAVAKGVALEGRISADVSF